MISKLTNKLTDLEEYKTSGHVMLPISLRNELIKFIRKHQNCETLIRKWVENSKQMKKYAEKMFRFSEKWN